MATPLEQISYTNAPQVVNTQSTSPIVSTTASGGGGGGSWGSGTTTAVTTPIKPLIISTSEPAKSDLVNIKSQFDTVTQNRDIAKQTAVQKQAEDAALYEKNPYWKRPTESIDEYNTRIAQMRAGGVIPPAETSPVDTAIKEATPSDATLTEANKIATGYVETLADMNAKVDAEYKDYQTKLANAYAGTDITPDQQAQLDAVNRKFDELKDLQITANKNYEGGTTAMGLVSGRSRYAPEIASGEIKAAVDSGIRKLNELEAQRASTLAELKDAFITKNAARIKDAWASYSEYTANKTKVLKEMHDIASQAEKTQREWNYKVAQDAITNAFNDNKLNWEQKQDILRNTLEQNKFDYQKTQDLKEYALKQEELALKREEVLKKKTEAERTLKIAGLDPNSSTYIQDVMAASAGGKAVDVATRTKFSKSLAVLGQLSELQKNITGESTGPIIGILRSANPYDTKAQLISAQIQAIVPNLARGVYGEVGVLTDNDIALYSKTLPNMKSTEAVRKAVLAMTIKTVQRTMEMDLQIAAGTGLDVAGLKNVYDKIKVESDAINQSLGINPGDDDLTQFYSNADESTRIKIEQFINEHPEASEAEIIEIFK